MDDSSRYLAAGPVFLSLCLSFSFSLCFFGFDFGFSDALAGTTGPLPHGLKSASYRQRPLADSSQQNEQ